jgi:hypothetical protein
MRIKPDNRKVSGHFYVWSVPGMVPPVPQEHPGHPSKNAPPVPKDRAVFSSTFLVVSRFRMFLNDEIQKHYKKRFAKQIVSKSFYKKIDQKSKTDCFSILFHHVLGRFSVRGDQKHTKSIEK